MEPVLTPEELRVLGALIEKGITTPDYYPMTLNGLTAACNQKSNRDPVLEFGEKISIAMVATLYDGFERSSGHDEILVGGTSKQSPDVDRVLGSPFIVAGENLESQELSDPRHG